MNIITISGTSPIYDTHTHVDVTVQYSDGTSIEKDLTEFACNIPLCIKKGVYTGTRALNVN